MSRQKAQHGKHEALWDKVAGGVQERLLAGIPQEGRAKIYQRLAEVGARLTWHEFNAAHAFLRDEGERFDAATAHLCHSLAADLFKRGLG